MKRFLTRHIWQTAGCRPRSFRWSAAKEIWRNLGLSPKFLLFTLLVYLPVETRPGMTFLVKRARRLILREALPFGIAPLLAALLNALIAFWRAVFAWVASFFWMNSSAFRTEVRVALRVAWFLVWRSFAWRARLVEVLVFAMMASFHHRNSTPKVCVWI